MPRFARSCQLAAACGLLALLPFVPALASPAAASACAAKLSPESQIIYQATAPHVTAGADLRAILKSTTRSLVMSGRIQRDGARPAAIAAYPCLKQLP